MTDSKKKKILTSKESINSNQRHIEKWLIFIELKLCQTVLSVYTVLTHSTHDSSVGEI